MATSQTIVANCIGYDKREKGVVSHNRTKRAASKHGRLETGDLLVGLVKRLQNLTAHSDSKHKSPLCQRLHYIDKPPKWNRQYCSDTSGNATKQASTRTTKNSKNKNKEAKNAMAIQFLHVDIEEGVAGGGASSFEGAGC
jgi:hypothetical protein